jgi:hypothetical protein
MEYDGEDEFYGYMVLNGDRENAELGYQSKHKLFNALPFLNLDYHYEQVTIAEIKKQLDIKNKRSV